VTTSRPLSPAHQAGQLLMAAVPGNKLDEETAALIRDLGLGGVCLFLHNCAGGPDQVRALTSQVQSVAREAGLPPLLIAVDQEGGVVTRLRHPFAVFPSQMAQAATGDPENAYRVAKAMAVEMRAVGINWDFAPVLDVNCNAANPVIGVRSFGADAETVSRFGLAALRGYADGGVLACGKHFPGHGDTHVDSHLDLPTVDFDRARLDAVELAPFRAAIAAGIPSLMTAHIRFPALDDLPATLSPTVLQGLLRGELGFSGLVITDALNMLAIANAYGPAESAVRAIIAGADQCIALFDPADLRAAHAAIITAVQSGRLPGARFREALGHVRALKARLAAPAAGEPLPFPVAAHQELARRVAAASVTIHRNRGLLPLLPGTAGRVGLIDFTLVRFSMVEEAQAPALHLQRILSERLPGLRSLMLDSEPTSAEAASAVALAGECDTLVIVVRNAGFIAEQADLVRALLALGKPAVVYAARLPYDAALFPAAAASLATYGDPPCSLEAAAAVVLGEAAR